jgi:hypothetical protein
MTGKWDGGIPLPDETALFLIAHHFPGWSIEYIENLPEYRFRLLLKMIDVYEGTKKMEQVQMARAMTPMI